jgi:hypothetical protein
MMKVIFFLITLSFCALTVFGQEIEAPLCKDVESKVVIPLKPRKIWRKPILEKECNFNLSYSANEKVAIYIEEYESDAKSSEELGRFSRIFTVYDDTKNPPKHRYKKINKDKYWNEAIAYKNDKPDHFILLRHRNYLITILSSDYKLLKKTELLLRNIRFENY